MAAVAHVTAGGPVQPPRARTSPIALAQGAMGPCYGPARPVPGRLGQFHSLSKYFQILL